MDDAHDRPAVWSWAALIIGPFLVYWLSVGPFFHWEQSARTQKQYLARKALEGRLYAPLIWVAKRDTTGTVAGLTYRSIQPWVSTRFDYTKLPRQ